MTANGRFALIPLGEHESPPANAVGWGDVRTALAPLPGSLGREEAAEILQFCRDAVDQHRQHAEWLQHYEAELADTRAHTRQIIDEFGAYFSGLKAERDAERQRQARADRRKAIEDGLPDPDAPDAPRGGYPEPSLEPDPRDEEPGRFPDDDELAYDLPAELPEDAPRTDDRLSGDLPEDVERRSPPPLGTMPVWSVRELKHPQEIPPTPSAIGGD
jgi:hypothetical protein